MLPRICKRRKLTIPPAFHSCIRGIMKTLKIATRGAAVFPRPCQIRNEQKGATNRADFHQIWTKRKKLLKFWKRESVEEWNE